MTHKFEEWVREHGLTGTQLKFLAITTMFIDHMGAICFPGLWELRVIGRIAFPVFCFLMAEGAYYTSDIRKYELRLLVFALLSEIPFDYAFYGELFYTGYQNVFFTLLAGLLCIDVFRSKGTNWGIGAFLILAALAELMHTDYGAAGVLFVVLFYRFREQRFMGQIMFGICNAVCFFSALQTCASLASIPLVFYSGKPGRKMRWMFYIFYPVHLLFLAGIHNLFFIGRGV